VTIACVGCCSISTGLLLLLLLLVENGAAADDAGAAERQQDASAAFVAPTPPHEGTRPLELSNRMQCDRSMLVVCLSFAEG